MSTLVRFMLKRKWENCFTRDNPNGSQYSRMKSVQQWQSRSAAFLRPTAILILALTSLGTGIEPSYSALDPILPEPLLKQGTLPPEDEDGPFLYWSQRKKYFLVIAVNETSVPKTDLPFAQVDGQRVTNALIGLGYQPLDPAYSLLAGTDATAIAIEAALNKARKKREEATVVIYYTGHGAVDAKDLWLQTAGQVKVGAEQGVAVSDLIKQIRLPESEARPGHPFEGELILILDACYSGKGTLSDRLTLSELGKHTTILTSSSDTQESFSLNPPQVPKQMSAFTYTLLQGLGPDWANADGNHDGILHGDELGRVLN